MQILFDTLSKYQIRDLKAKCDARIVPFDLLPQFPVEIILLVVRNLDNEDVARCFRVSKVWRSQLYTSRILRRLLLNVYPRDKSDLQDYSVGQCQKKLQQIHNFKIGEIKSSIHVSKISDTNPTSSSPVSTEQCHPQTGAIADFVWPKLALLRSGPGRTSCIELNTILEDGLDQSRFYFGQDRETFQFVKCSSALLFGISTFSRCYIWEHTRSEPMTTFKIEPGVIEAIDISDIAVVILQHPLRFTTWSSQTQKVLQFTGLTNKTSKPSKGQIYYDVLLEPKDSTFTLFSRSTEYYSAERYNFAGDYLAKTQHTIIRLDGIVDRHQPDNTRRLNKIQRYSRDEFLIWALRCYEDNPLYQLHTGYLRLVLFNSRSRTFTTDIYETPIRDGAEICDIVVQQRTVYVIWGSQAFGCEMSIWKLKNDEAKKVRNNWDVDYDWNWLFGDERLLLHVDPSGYTAMWFA